MEKLDIYGIDPHDGSESVIIQNVSLVFLEATSKQPSHDLRHTRHMYAIVDNTIGILRYSRTCSVT